MKRQQNKFVKQFKQRNAIKRESQATVEYYLANHNPDSLFSYLPEDLHGIKTHQQIKAVVRSRVKNAWATRNKRWDEKTSLQITADIKAAIDKISVATEGKARATHIQIPNGLFRL